MWVFMCFNCGDCMGKGLPKLFQLFKPERPNLLLIGFAIEVPLFSLLFVFALHDEIWPEVFASDYYCYVMVFLFAAYHGYLSCSSFLAMPVVGGQSPASRAMAGSLSFTGLAVGIFLGSALAIGIKQIPH